MLRIPIQLIDANTGRVSDIARIAIVNDGSGDDKLGNYRYAIEFDDIAGGKKRHLAGKLKNWERGKGALQLLRRVLQDTRI